VKWWHTEPCSKGGSSPCFGAHQFKMVLWFLMIHNQYLIADSGDLQETKLHFPLTVENETKMCFKKRNALLLCRYEPFSVIWLLPITNQIVKPLCYLKNIYSARPAWRSIQSTLMDTQRTHLASWPETSDSNGVFRERLICTEVLK
jgi:hypothetical protein